MKFSLKIAKMTMYAALIGEILLCYTLISGGEVKTSPEFVGVAPEAQKYVDQWLELAKDSGLKFKHKVTIGFKEIGEDKVVGLCHYGSGFREIDIDSAFWKRSTGTSRMVLVMHEMSHCACSRDHDFGDGKKYDEDDHTKPEDGFYEDGCALSIMHPVIVTDKCALSHYQRYMAEMLERCKAY